MNTSFFTQVVIGKLIWIIQWFMRNNFIWYSIVCSRVKLDVKGQVQGHFRKKKSTKMVYTTPQLNDFNNFGVLPL